MNYWLGRTACFLALWTLLKGFVVDSSELDDVRDLFKVVDMEVSSRTEHSEALKATSSRDSMGSSIPALKKEIDDLECSLEGGRCDGERDTSVDSLEKLRRKVKLLTTRLDQFEEEQNSRMTKLLTYFKREVNYLRSSTVRCCSQGRKLTIGGDDKVILYLDGEKIDLLRETSWNTTETVLLPDTTRVIAVKGVNYYGDAGILASTPDGFVITNSSWKCKHEKLEGWETVGFDDSDWLPADTVTVYQEKPMPDIRKDAWWIWTSKYHWKTGDRHVHCRLNLPESRETSEF